MCLNLREGGDHSLLSDETKKLIGYRLKGKHTGPLSDNHKRKISNAHKQIEHHHLHTEETKQKISKLGKGRSPWNKGKKGIYSEEQIRKISEASKGRKLSEEQKQKISNDVKGKRHMTLNGHSVFVKAEDINKYLSLGYHFGRK